MRVLVIADTDLDGVGSAALIDLYYNIIGGATVEAYFPNRNRLNEQFGDDRIVKKWAVEYDLVYLCDTGLDDPDSYRNLGRILGPKTTYFDHHQSNHEKSEVYAGNFLGYHVMEGDRCTAKIVYDTILASGSLLKGECERFKEAEEFVTLVNDLDFWLLEYSRSLELGDVVAVLGPDRAFMELKECVTNAYHNSPVMQEAIETARMRKSKSFRLAKETLVKHEGYKVPLYTAMCRGHASEVSHHLVHSRGLIILYDTVSGTMCARRGTKAAGDANCLDFAGLFGGGGHPFAAGFPAERILKQMSRTMGQYMIEEWNNGC
jgi:oligoribonuclease NrnB/cAMP/cGMP phosphodiesterase (DHH superfamily)